MARTRLLPRYIMMQNGFLTFRETPSSDLKVMLTKLGREAIKDRMAEPDHHVFFDLFEGFRQDSNWDEVYPEEIGALTGCPIIICSDVQVPDCGPRQFIGQIYWFSHYAMDSITEELFNKGFYILERAR